MANADANGHTKSSFADVKSDVYYMGYIEWASKNSIVNGTGNGEFAPDQSITREQMAVIMQNYAEVIGFTLPKVHGENQQSVQPAGYGSPRRGDRGTAPLRVACNLSESMQGWTRNDSGLWMYYENGKAVTGKRHPWLKLYL